MKLKVLLFAEARDIAAVDFLEIEVNSAKSSKEAIFEALGNTEPDLKIILKTCNLAHNQVSLLKNMNLLSPRMLLTQIRLPLPNSSLNIYMEIFAALITLDL